MPKKVEQQQEVKPGENAQATPKVELPPNARLLENGAIRIDN